MVEWKYSGDYTKNPQKFLNKINMDEVMGFHINNDVFNKFITNNHPVGFFF